jgi:hypothetical protein
VYTFSEVSTRSEHSPAPPHLHTTLESVLERHKLIRLLKIRISLSLQGAAACNGREITEGMISALLKSLPPSLPPSLSLRSC